MDQSSQNKNHTKYMLTPWQAVRHTLALWHAQAARLVIGVVLALLALCLGFALMQTSGLRVAGTVLGSVLVTTSLLRWVGAGRVILRYAERLFAHDAMFRALASLRVWFFRSLADGAAAGLGFKRAGDMLSRLVSDIGALDGLYLRILLPFACACLTVPTLLLVLGKHNMLLGGGVAVLFGCSAFLIPYLIAVSGRKEAEKLTRDLADLRIGVLDLVSGLREIRAFGADKRVLAHIQATDTVLLDGQMRLAKRAAKANVLAYLLGQSAIFLVLAAVSGKLFLNITPLAGVGCLFLVVAAFESASTLTRAGLQAGAMGAAAQRVMDIATSEPHSHTTGTVLQEAPLHPSIHIENLYFRWSEDRPYVFKGLTLNIAAGSRVALLGPSGVGKSSLAALLLKAASPESGQITFDGIDLATIETSSLRQRIAWLSQATHLFDDSIRANLLLGRPDATEDDLWRALEDAAVADVVRNLPEGLDTWLGEGGIKLSGGQGRRIALARTLLTQAPVLILDEPATGLDAQTEHDFLETLNKVTEGRTVILIAHRLTGVEKLDCIWRLSGGTAAVSLT
ncbi:MAG: thiol reductant ABC exporter subunit CydC [Acetobacter cibinongensis]